MELWCPRLLSERWGLRRSLPSENVVQEEMLKLSCLPHVTPRLSIRQHHLPVVRGLEPVGLFFPFSQTFKIAGIGYGLIRPDGIALIPLTPKPAILSGRRAAGGGGLAGARKRLQSQQHISDSTTFSGSLEGGGPCSPLPVRLAPGSTKIGRLIQNRSSRPARTARQYPMLEAFYISNSKGFMVFVWFSEVLWSRECGDGRSVV